MPFYVNKKTSESTWDLPEELAWERVNHEVRILCDVFYRENVSVRERERLFL